MCKSKSTAAGKRQGQQRKPSVKPVHLLEQDLSEADDKVEKYELYGINSASKPQPYKTFVEIDGKSLPLEIDSGASLTLVSERTLRDNLPDLKLSPSEISLRSYSGESIPVLGSVNVTVKYSNQEASLPLIVVKGDGPSLLGRNWLCHLKLNWHEIFWSHSLGSAG